MHFLLPFYLTPQEGLEPRAASFNPDILLAVPADSEPLIGPFLKDVLLMLSAR